MSKHWDPRSALACRPVRSEEARPAATPKARWLAGLDGDVVLAIAAALLLVLATLLLPPAGW
ncbi:MAG TPA: hypothetical protein VF727_12960 [Allosphingosinicella sp.]